MNNKWYSLFKVILGPPLMLWNRPTIEGAENIPDEGAAILVSNHQAVLDSFYLPLLVKRQITFPAKKEYFTGKGISGRIQKFFFSSVGQIPVDRDAKNAGDALNTAAESVLSKGDLFGIYPEGTRSPDGRVYKGRTGMARIAMPSGAPVVLIGMVDSGKANPIGTSIPRPVKVGIKVSKPIYPRAWAEANGYDPDSRGVMRPFTDYCMRRLADMVGQDYVDLYASDVKKALAETGEYPEEARR